MFCQTVSKRNRIMLTKSLLVILCSVLLQHGSCMLLRRDQKISRSLPAVADAGEPLFLTPLIQDGRLDEALQLATVQNITDLTSYSGYLTVNQEFNSNLFFWFFLSENDPANDPLILWLQGGPGVASTYGLFNENGPFSVDEDLNLVPREHAWTRKYNVLYIDSPAGTGYSFTDSEDGLAKDETDVGRDLYEALVQFFTLFSDFQKNDFFVVGESYGGKYVPAISYKIHTENPAAELKINFKGLAIGNGVSDPYSMMGFGDFLYEIGLIDSTWRDIYREAEVEGQYFIDNEMWSEAADRFQLLAFGGAALYGDVNPYNYLQMSQSLYGGWDSYLQQTDVRGALHVGNQQFDSGNVMDALWLDQGKSVKPWVEVLADNYPTLVYNGHLDICVTYVLSENFLLTLDWSGAEEWKNTTRNVWTVGSEIAGYAKNHGYLTEVMVRNAGHMVPTEQPVHTLDMLDRFFTGKGFN